MSVLTYKCPNCGGGLIFDPEKQQYICEFCISEFTKETLDTLNPPTAAESTTDTVPENKEDVDFMLRPFNWR